MQKMIRKHEGARKALQLAALVALLFFATCAHSALKTVLVLGDSLSAEYGIARGTGWVSLLEKRIASSKLDADIVNASISGETTSGGRSRLPRLLKDHHPAVVVIELGGNDGLRGLSLKATESNLRAMIGMAQKAGARVLLIGMRIPPNYGRAYTERFFLMYGKLAREMDVELVPFLLEGVAGHAELFQSDRIHPTSAAQPTMLENVWPHLQRMLTR